MWKFYSQVLWEWSTGGETPIWGDADMLPTNNVVGPSWDQYVDPTATDGISGYHAHIWEVTAEKEVAWGLHVAGECIPAYSCDPSTQERYLRRTDDAPRGWAIYSAERYKLLSPCTARCTSSIK